MTEGYLDPHPGHLSGSIGKAFLLMINILMIQKGGIAPLEDYPDDFGPILEGNSDVNFDFIIVGAGTAGCILANRLSEYQDWKILLVEAGGDPSSSADVPAFYYTLRNTKEDWKFITAKNDSWCQGMIDQRCRIPRGKVLGGTSSIDNMHYSRGNPMDFDKWEADGNFDWGTESTNFFFSRIENYKGPSEYPITFKTDGEISLDLFNSEHHAKDLIYSAVDELNYGKLKENEYLGYIDNVVMVDAGTRFNMAKAFLTPVKDRNNLYVAKNALVTKILIPDPTEKRVRGVEVSFAKSTVKLRAKREVIVTAGAINTPKLLMLSGVGPAKHLKQFDLPVLVDLKVGSQMQIQYSACVFVGIDKEAEPVDQETELIDGTYLYVMHRRGPLAMTNINDLVGFINTRKDPYEYPNMQVYHYFFNQQDFILRGFLEEFGFVESIVKSLVNYNQDQSILMFMPTVLNPKSRGRVQLNSTNPYDRPKIEPNYFVDEDNEDFATLVSGFKYITKLAETKAFKARRATLLHVDIPNCRNFKFCTEAYIQCAIKNMAFPQSHVSGTTRMGPICKQCSVVDDDLLIKRVRGLRIVGASIMPSIVSGSTRGSTAMIADKASEIIKERWIKDYQPQPKCRCKTQYDIK